MTISIVHSFVSAKADGSDTQLVQPSDWNDEHTITLAAGRVLGRNAASAGAVEELYLTYTAGATGTGTGAWTGAVGTTAQRPATPSTGMERWNTTTVAKELYNGTSWITLLAAGAITSFAPTGRLTLESGVPVSSSDQAGKATIYYTPAGVGYAQYPSYDGTSWSVIAFSELSNDTTQSSTNKAGAAAAGPYQIQDCFVWSDAGTNRLTRGPKWVASSTATITNATPAVVTWTGHGLWDGATVRFTTTGGLPTGLAVNTDYFVTKVDANTFKLSTTLVNQIAGTYIATSSAGSGTHTAYNYTSVRGTGATTTELQLLNGVWVNKYDITNGPAATKGTYVGSVYFNASSQMDLRFRTLASSFSSAIYGIWNMYNRVFSPGHVIQTAGWSSSSAIRCAAGSEEARVTVVAGMKEDSLSASFGVAVYAGGAGANINMYTSFNSSQAGLAAVTGSPGGHGYGSPTGAGTGQPFGLNYASAMDEFVSGSAYSTGGNGGLVYQWRY